MQDMQEDNRSANKGNLVAAAFQWVVGDWQQLRGILDGGVDPGDEVIICTAGIMTRLKVLEVEKVGGDLAPTGKAG